MVEIKRITFFLPFIVFIIYQSVKAIGISVDLLIRQEGILDSLQFPIYSITGFLTLKLSRRLNGINKYLLIFFGLIIFFVAFEEISWGQHLIRFPNLDFFTYNNLQNEFNVHNLRSVQGATHLCYIFAGLIFSVKVILIKLSLIKSKYLFLIPGISYIGFNSPLALYYFIFFYTPFQSRIINYVGQEYFEFMFSLGLLLHFIELINKSKLDEIT